MDYTGFLSELSDLLEVDAEELNNEFELNKENFDSVNIVSTIALIDEHFDVTVKGKSLAQAKTVGELLELIKAEKNGKF